MRASEQHDVDQGSSSPHLPDHLQKRDHSDVLAALGTTRNEDLRLLADCDAILASRSSRRDPGSARAVVVPASGGVDSLGAMLLCLHEGWAVYPVFIDRGQTNLEHERAAARALCATLRDRFPGWVAELKEVESHFPPVEFKVELRKVMLNKGYPLRNTMIAALAVQYARYLGVVRGRDDLKTVALGYTLDDSDEIVHSTVTSCRLFNLEVCFELEDWSWRVVPVLKDPDLGYLLDKAATIELINANGFSLAATRSCVAASADPCGACHACRDLGKAKDRLGQRCF